MIYSIELRAESAMATIVLHGGIDATPPSRLQDIVRASTELGIVDLVVDLRDVERLEPRLAATLSVVSRRLAARKGSMRLVTTNERTGRHLRRYGLADPAVLHASLADAVSVSPAASEASRPGPQP